MAAFPTVTGHTSPTATAPVPNVLNSFVTPVSTPKSVPGTDVAPGGTAGPVTLRGACCVAPLNAVGVGEVIPSLVVVEALYFVK